MSMYYTKQQLLDFYEAEGRRGDHQKNMYFSNKSPHSRQRFERVKDLLSQYVPDQRFLELGCAEGLYCQEAERLTDKLVVGMDISMPKIMRCRRGFKHTLYMQGDWDNLPFGENEFDVALLTEGLEHSLDPGQLLRNIASISRVLILTVPLEKSLLAEPLGKDSNGHLHLFTYDKAKKMMEGAGYTVVDGVASELYAYLVGKK